MQATSDAEERRIHVITHVREDRRAVIQHGVDAHELLEHRQRDAHQHHARSRTRTAAPASRRGRGRGELARAWRALRRARAERDSSLRACSMRPVLTSQLGDSGTEKLR